MARQVRPWSAEPRTAAALRVRQSSWDPTSKSHQGQRLCRSESPDVRVQSNLRPHRELKAWQTGASMYSQSRPSELAERSASESRLRCCSPWTTASIDQDHLAGRRGSTRLGHSHLGFQRPKADARRASGQAADRRWRVWRLRAFSAALSGSTNRAAQTARIRPSLAGTLPSSKSVYVDAMASLPSPVTTFSHGRAGSSARFRKADQAPAKRS